MPPRHLGLAALGSSATLRASISFDFLLPFATTPPPRRATLRRAPRRDFTTTRRIDIDAWRGNAVAGPSRWREKDRQVESTSISSEESGEDIARQEGFRPGGSGDPADIGRGKERSEHGTTEQTTTKDSIVSLRTDSADRIPHSSEHDPHTTSSTSSSDPEHPSHPSSSSSHTSALFASRPPYLAPPGSAQQDYPESSPESSAPLPTSPLYPPPEDAAFGKDPLHITSRQAQIDRLGKAGRRPEPSRTPVFADSTTKDGIAVRGSERLSKRPSDTDPNTNTAYGQRSVGLVGDAQFAKSNAVAEDYSEEVTTTSQGGLREEATRVESHSTTDLTDLRNHQSGSASSDFSSAPFQPVPESSDLPSESVDPLEPLEPLEPLGPPSASPSPPQSTSRLIQSLPPSESELRQPFRLDTVSQKTLPLPPDSFPKAQHPPPARPVREQKSTETKSPPPRPQPIRDPYLSQLDFPPNYFPRMRGGRLRHRRSIVHEHRQGLNPPPPPLLINFLQQHPSLITAAALTALIDHSIRTGHFQQEKMARMARARVDATHVATAREVSAPNLIKLRREPWRAHGKRPHGWARDAWRPKAYYRPRTMRDLMCDLHYHLLNSDVPATELDCSQAVERVRAMCDLEHRGPDGIIEALIGLTHLFVIYAERQPGQSISMRMLRRFLVLCPEIKPNKQTLHLMVQEILWPTLLIQRDDPDLIPLSIPAENSPTGEALNLHPETPDDIPPEYKEIYAEHMAKEGIRYSDVSEEPDAPLRLATLLRTFQLRFDCTPGTETFRQLSKFALAKDDPTTGEIVFEGWWAAAAERRSATPGEGDTAKYRHDGQRWILWRSWLRVLIRRGWVRRVEHRSGMLREGYEWMERRDVEVYDEDQEGKDGREMDDEVESSGLAESDEEDREDSETEHGERRLRVGRGGADEGVEVEE